MKLTTIREIYKNREAYLDKEVTVGGWVRSVRDSKTFGFIVLHDGSYFETLQIVYHDEMENFAEISKMNVGAAIIVKGTLVATPQAKQPFEIQATEVTVEGGFRTGLPAAEKTPLHGIPSYHFPSASENQHLPGSIPCSFPLRLCDPSVLPGERLRLCEHPADHRKRLRGSRRDVPGNHHGS